ncbi:MAG: exo-beta-1,3-glucanase, partial [Methylobacter sp.]
ALLIMGLILIIWESKAFMVSRDFILAYPNIGERLGVAFIFSVTNCQLLVWLLCLAILALPLLANSNKAANQ